jgi:hypothetical protein
VRRKNERKRERVCVDINKERDTTKIHEQDEQNRERERQPR